MSDTWPDLGTPPRETPYAVTHTFEDACLKESGLGCAWGDKTEKLVGPFTRLCDLHKGFSGVGSGLTRYIWDVYQIGKQSFFFFLALRGTRLVQRGVGSDI